MFARRFTIVSLMTILFGLVFAQIVAGSARDGHWQPGHVVACTFDDGLSCAH